MAATRNSGGVITSRKVSNCARVEGRWLRRIYERKKKERKNLKAQALPPCVAGAVFCRGKYLGMFAHLPSLSLRIIAYYHPFTEIFWLRAHEEKHAVLKHNRQLPATIMTRNTRPAPHAKAHARRSWRSGEAKRSLTLCETSEVACSAANWMVVSQETVGRRRKWKACSKANVRRRNIDITSTSAASNVGEKWHQAHLRASLSIPRSTGE